jgi:hypothetical protein
MSSGAQRCIDSTPTHEQVRMSPGHPQPCRGHGDLLIPPRGGGLQAEAS